MTIGLEGQNGARLLTGVRVGEVQRDGDIGCMLAADEGRVLQGVMNTRGQEFQLDADEGGLDSGATLELTDGIPDVSELAQGVDVLLALEVGQVNVQQRAHQRRLGGAERVEDRVAQLRSSEQAE
ncbi:hypothetical protein PG996_010898 [Apiospora saccharicola]|uniref:Uncharacterized protein n=1 Tax=Apiospora saccharicola TaxID=335842 RepID=A0ABR1UPY4_9PEZI